MDLAQRISNGAVAALDLVPLDSRFDELSRRVLQGGATRFAAVVNPAEDVDYVIPVGVPLQTVHFGALVVQQSRAGLLWREGADERHLLVALDDDTRATWTPVVLGGEVWIRFDVDDHDTQMSVLAPPTGSAVLRDTLIRRFRATEASPVVSDATAVMPVVVVPRSGATPSWDEGPDAEGQDADATAVLYADASADEITETDARAVGDAFPEPNVVEPQQPDADATAMLYADASTDEITETDAAHALAFVQVEPEGTEPEATAVWTPDAPESHEITTTDGQTVGDDAPESEPVESHDQVADATVLSTQDAPEPEPEPEPGQQQEREADATALWTPDADMIQSAEAIHALPAQEPEPGQPREREADATALWTPDADMIQSAEAILALTAPEPEPQAIDPSTGGAAEPELEVSAPAAATAIPAPSPWGAAPEAEAGPPTAGKPAAWHSGSPDSSTAVQPSPGAVPQPEPWHAGSPDSSTVIRSAPRNVPQWEQSRGEPLYRDTPREVGSPTTTGAGGAGSTFGALGKSTGALGGTPGALGGSTGALGGTPGAMPGAPYARGQESPAGGIPGQPVSPWPSATPQPTPAWSGTTKPPPTPTWTNSPPQPTSGWSDGAPDQPIWSSGTPGSSMDHRAHPVPTPQGGSQTLVGFLIGLIITLFVGGLALAALLFMR